MESRILATSSMLIMRFLVWPGSALFDLVRQHSKLTVGEEDGICFVGRECCQ